MASFSGSNWKTLRQLQVEPRLWERHIKPRRWSENANWELWLRDPDGYTVVLTSPLP